MTKKNLLAGLALAAASTMLPAQTFPPPQNVLQLQASGTVEVQQDLLQMNLTTARDGTDPAAVQTQLKTALDAALAEARKTAQPGQLDVRTGNFALYPRHNREGRISGWTGTAELILEGRDLARITQAAGRIQTMTLGGVSFGLSREQRARVEGEAQAIGPTQRPPQDLRQALQQYQPGERAPVPRQLTAGERAELRRQLADQGQGQGQGSKRR